MYIMYKKTKLLIYISLQNIASSLTLSIFASWYTQRYGLLTRTPTEISFLLLFVKMLKCILRRITSLKITTAKW